MATDTALIKEILDSCDARESAANEDRWTAAELIHAKLIDGYSLRQLAKELDRGHNFVRRYSMVWDEFGEEAVPTGYSLSFSACMSKVRARKETAPEPVEVAEPAPEVEIELPTESQPEPNTAFPLSPRGQLLWGSLAEPAAQLPAPWPPPSLHAMNAPTGSGSTSSEDGGKGSTTNKGKAPTTISYTMDVQPRTRQAYENINELEPLLDRDCGVEELRLVVKEIKMLQERTTRIAELYEVRLQMMEGKVLN